MESVEKLMINLDFFNGKTVLVTGHTGFKGSWISRVLINSGAKVVGYSLQPTSKENLFSICNNKDMKSFIGDIRDLEKLKKVFAETQPEMVIHLAAQPLVIESYVNPVYTYETNVMGTVNMCECVRMFTCVKSFLNVTTDKVYKNKEWEWGYREDELLDGFDPYSNSKSCSELVTHSYKNSFFQDDRVAISTARAGNVIGGGDFAENRIIPDCVRAVLSNQIIKVRNPYSIRPYQHVLEPIMAYLMILQRQYEDRNLQGYYNVGPEDKDCITTGQVVSLFCEKWGDNVKWISQSEHAFHEANFLKLDCSRLKNTFGWIPSWNIETAIEKTVEWTKHYSNNKDVSKCMDEQIKEFIKEMSNGR